jgi:hypothetical protein
MKQFRRITRHNAVLFWEKEKEKEKEKENVKSEHRHNVGNCLGTFRVATMSMYI